MPESAAEFGEGGGRADRRLDAPAFHRNHAPIWAVVAPFLQDRTGDALEVGSGTGQHVVEFARKSPGIAWWPSDVDPRSLASVVSWRALATLPNLRAPSRVDLSDPDWDSAMSGPLLPRRLLAIVCINVLHISPSRVAENLLAGAGRRIAPDGHLFVYGPFRIDGAHTAPSNAAFDASLRSQNAEWGVRDTRDLAALAAQSGLRLETIAPMPANNFTLVFGPTNPASS